MSSSNASMPPSRRSLLSMLRHPLLVMTFILIFSPCLSPHFILAPHGYFLMFVHSFLKYRAPTVSTENYTKCWRPLPSYIPVSNQPRFTRNPLHGTKGPGEVLGCGARRKTCLIQSLTGWRLRSAEDAWPTHVFILQDGLSNGGDTAKRCVFNYRKSRVTIPDSSI